MLASSGVPLRSHLSEEQIRSLRWVGLGPRLVSVVLGIGVIGAESLGFRRMHGLELRDPGSLGSPLVVEVHD
jgi:hypothetical protein